MKEMQNLFGVLAFGSLCMVAGIASGQMTGGNLSGNPIDTVDSDADVIMMGGASSDIGLTFDLGKSQFRPSLGVWFGYDDNLYVGRAGSTTSDTYIAIAPGLEFRYGTLDYISLKYSHEWYFYNDESSEDYDSDIFTGTLHFDLPKTDVHIHDTLRDTTGANYERADRLSQLHNTIMADIERKISRKTSVALRGGHELHDYKSTVEGAGSTLLQFIDYSEYTLGTRGYWQVLPKSDAFGEVAYGWVELDQPVSGSSYANADYYELSLGLRGHLTAKTILTGRVGYQHRTFTGPVDDIGTWTTEAAVKSELRKNLTTGLRLRRALYPSVVYLGTTMEASRVSPYVRYNFWHNKFTLYANGMYELSEYVEADGSSDRRDTYWHVLGLLDWHICEYVSVGAGYVYSQNDSNEDDYDIDRGQAIVRAFGNY